MSEDNNYTGMEIAVIGMAGRFPGAANIGEFWDNLKNGIETNAFFSDPELEEAGTDKDMLKNPNYVKATAVLTGIEEFDAHFFDYAPFEAEIMDPQFRLFQECAWETLEDAGYVPDYYDGLIGLYAGASDSFYWKGLAILSGKLEQLGQFGLDQLTNRDYLCSRVAYKLNLRGPVAVVQTACSTSLVAIHLACQALLSGETDIGLAGGVSVGVVKSGYLYQEGMVLSPDGHCRAFDGSAGGFFPGNGVALVALKRLEEAAADHDHIYAVIKGSAINNDGQQKPGYTAPSVEGQSDAIKDALQTAQVEAESIGYIEAHGTATPLGDPVEIEALTVAFNTTKKAYCAVGSVKSNFGHLDAAAGAAGFIKAVLALNHQMIPPSLHFEIPNHNINLIAGPFYINAGLSRWENKGKYPRRAGVSSLGIGGTNAHAVLEEWPRPSPAAEPTPQLILLSAKTGTALERMKENLAEYLKSHPSVILADVAYTLQVGRKALRHRWIAPCSSVPKTLDALKEPSSEVFGGVGTFFQKGSDPPEAIIKSWLEGGQVDWSEFYSEDPEKPYRVPLPTYPFERQRYWLEGKLSDLGADIAGRGPQPGKKHDIADWFYIPSWKRVGIAGPAVRAGGTVADTAWLLFIDNCGLGAGLAEQLRQSGEYVVTVEIGEVFQKVNSGRFILAPRRESDYERLFHELPGHDRVPRRIVHLWSVTGRASVGVEPDPGFYSLLYIARAIGARGLSDEIRLTAVSDNMQEIVGGDGTCPGKAVVLGPVKVIPTEYPNIACFSIDVRLPAAGEGGGPGERLIGQLVEELTAGSHDPVTAYRGGYRWVQVFEPQPFGEAKKANLCLKEKGVYLVTGGLGGIGLALAGYLAKSVRAKLVLTGRRELPAAARRQKIEELERLGAEVRVCRADVTDHEDMERVFVEAEESFGPVNGIIHCAGLPDGEMIQRRTPGASQRIFAAKVTGTLVLDRLIKDMKEAPDFFILCSSVTAILPMIGQVAYCAANAFLDAYAHYNRGNKTAVLSLNWDRWKSTGIAVIAENMHKELTGEELTGGMTCEEGVEVFGRVLAHKFHHAQVVLSTWDLGLLLQQAHRFNASSLLGGVEKGVASPKTLIQRPQLGSEYVPPDRGNETQERLVHIWGNFFGFRQVGILDDFFELGGDSLKALILLPAINKELEVYVPIAEFFNRPTIRELSGYIEGADRSAYSSIEPLEKREYYPLSSAQKRLYLLQQMDLDGTGYNIPLVLPLGKDIEKDKLAATFRELIRRHESLRTSFAMLNEQPVQRIHDNVTFEMDYYEGTGCRGEPPCSPAGSEITIEDFVKTFDLTEAPLLRSGIVKNADGSHTWMVDVHHIVSDGMSQSILTGDFMSLYSGEALAPLRLQYRDFSEWQNRLFAGAGIKAKEDYWLDLYADAAEISRLNLPCDYKRPATFTFAGGHFVFSLDREETASFKELAAKNNATLYMNLLAALDTLFYKYTGQTDIVIGSGIAGRPREDLHRVIGMFVNTLAMRSFPRGEKTYAFFLQEVAALSLKAFENQDVQFEQLVNRLDLPRDPSRNPLFDISIVALDFGHAGHGGSGGLDAAYKNPTSRFDITFFVQEAAEGISIDIEYYTGIFREETIARLAAHFKNAVKSVVENPSIKLKNIEILTQEEKRKALYEFNDTLKEYPGDKTIHELLEEQAEQVPDHIAVVFADRVITYRELNRESGGLAVYLNEKGIRSEDIVGIMSDRSLEMIIGILGILKAGAAYLPVNSGLPEVRKEYILKDSGAKILLASERKGDRQIKIKPAPSAMRPAYVIYTSGSTGKPKGVMVEHRSVARLVKNSNYIQFAKKDRLLLNGALEFDISTFEIWGPLLNGSQLYLAEKDALLDAESLKHTLTKYDISILHLIPQLFNNLAGQEAGIFAGLAYLLVGGDLVGPAMIDRVRQRCGSLKILHMYGPTENTTFSSFLPVKRSYEGSMPIGKPIANSSVYILGPNNELMPIGASGEICTGGDGMARGYLNNPELTAERFGLRRPLCIAPGKRARLHYKHRTLEQHCKSGAPAWCLRRPGGSFEKLPPGPPQNFCLTGDDGFYMSYTSYLSYYKTGDLGRWLPDGNIEFLGRMDRQVKVRGVRIELGEIENRLLAKEGIEEAVVLAVKEGLEAKYLCAYIVSPRKFESAGLRDLLTGELPPAMIPAYFVQLDKMPLTASGKIDRKALPDPEAAAQQSIYIAPRDRVEEKLAGIWSKVLDMDGPIGLNDNFFHLGGHSLNAAILTARIHKELEVKVPLAEVFKNQTLRALAEYIKQTKKTVYAGIKPVEKKEYYALSSAQKRLYLLQQMDIHGTGYNMPMALPLGEDIEKERLEAAFKKLIARHESLRTSFVMVAEKPVQRIHETVTFNIEYCRGEPQCLPFDLTCAPLLRSAVVETPGGGCTWLIDMHHIISDGTSQAVLIEDFTALYNGGPLEPARLPVRYRDFSEWQNRLFDSGGIKEQEDYWLGLYPEGEEIPRLQLAADFKRPGVFTFAGSNYGFILEKEDAVKFKAHGSANGATLFMGILAVLNTLFYKYTGQTDIIIGSGTAGRPHADLQRIIGMFVNTLATRNRPHGEKTYDSFLKEVRDNSIRALDNQDVQFEELVDKLDLQRDTSRNPLFDIVAVVGNFTSTTGEKKKTGSGKAAGAKFDMTFFVQEAEEDIFIDIEYYTGIFREETMARLAAHFKNAVKGVVENPSLKLKDIEIITEEERRKVLYEFNGTVRDYPKDKTIHELFGEQAGKNPGGTALVWPASRLHITYEELNERSGRLADLLKGKGVQPGTIAGIMMERSIEMIVGLLGILKAGGAYLPIDPGHPEERKRYMLKDSGAKILLTEVTAGFAESPLPGGVPEGRGGLAYIIYTSGSTGRPKGVLITHANISPLLHWGYRLGIGPGDRTLQDLAYYFDWSVWEIFITLTSGACLYMVPDDILLNPGICAAFMEEKDVTVLHVTPTQFRYYVQTGQHLGTLKYLFIGAETLTGDMLRQGFASVGGDCRVFNMYGPTECTVIASALEIEKQAVKQFDNLSSIPIGQPAANAGFLILDRDKKLCPVNTPGELYIAGDGLSGGYLNNPELTAEKFLTPHPSPFTLHPSPLYKTGDFARRLPDGNVEFLGRIDHQVKIRGFRIELAEIENRLRDHEIIKDALVIAKDDDDGNKYLCAYIVTVPGDGRLREYLSGKLPAYMIPAYFIEVENFPLTANGKIDIKALPTPVSAPGAGYGGPYIAPRDESEEKLAAIWSEVLGVYASIGIDDSFFDLGGHSLKAAVLTSKIHKELGVKVPLVEVFKRRTIRLLSQYTAGLKESRYAGIEPVEKKEYYALSSAQKRLYFLRQMAPGSTGYNMPLVLSLGKDIEKEKLESTLKKLIARHESLRTSFERIGEVPVQRIHDKAAFEIEYDIAGRPASFIRPFDLTRAPLLRSGILKTPDGNYTWMVDMHHIISDGMSHAVLTEDFLSLYNGEGLGALRLQYKDFSQWQNRLFEKGEIKAQEEYWLELYRDPGRTPVLPLPADNKRPGVFTFAGDAYKFKLDRENASKFRKLGARYGATLYMNILAVLNTLFFKYTGQTDIIIGTGVAGRRHADLQGIIGMFINTLAMRNYPGGDKTYELLLKEVTARSVEALENQDLQFEDLVDKLHLERDPSRNPLFDVTMVVQDFMKAAEDMEGVNHAVRAKFDMTFFVQETGEGIYIDIEYYSAIFKRDTIQRLASHFKNVIKAVVEQPSLRLKAIDILTDEEKDRLLYEFNDTARAYPRDKTAHQLFADQAGQTPDRIAVTAAGRALTYKQLNSEANRMSRFLNGKGMGTDDIVGIVTHRSLETVIGIWGILTAGAAYLPLDPAYPQERIDYMLKDSGARILKTKSIGEIGSGDSPLLGGVPEGRGGLAYVIYTSGTTGRPKGTLIGHCSLVNLCSWHNRYYGVTERDRAAQYAGFGFDASVWEIFPYLLKGASVHIVDDETRTDIEKLNRYYRRHHITVAFLPGQFCRQFTAEVNGNPGLRLLLTGGEKLNRFIKRDYPLYNNYGPTENTVVTTAFPVEVQSDNIPIGKPVSNVRVYILNRDHFQLQPVGVPGELCIAGDGLAGGYLNRPELTAEKFIKQKFCGGPGGFSPRFSKEPPGRRRPRGAGSLLKIYKTGDLACWQPDGNIQFHGRLDHQVKVRGFRVELGEIETHLLKHSNIKEAAVLSGSDPGGDIYLCAYIVPAAGQMEEEKLRNHLAGFLPGYMVPSFFVFLEKMPLTLNEKIDTEALPLPAAGGGDMYIAPANAIEEQLAAIWAEVLVIDKEIIGRSANFFQLGGHSLKATIITSRIYEELGIKVPVIELFKSPTLSGLAEIAGKSAGETFVQIPPTAKKEYYELSFNQKRLWFMQQRDRENNSFNMPEMIPMQGPVEEKAVTRTLRKIIETHESLRTGFREVNGRAVQYIIEDHNPRFDTIDVSGLEEDEKRARLTGIIGQFNMRPFHLDEPPLFKALLLKVAEGQYIFAYNMHHIVSDGWSMGILKRDFQNIYNAYLNGSAVERGRPSITYKDFAHWHNCRLADEGRRKVSRQFWIDFLQQELPPLRLPGAARSEGSPQTKSGASYRFVIPADIKDGLNSLSRTHHITLFVLVYSLYNIFLSVVSGRQTVVTSILNAGRDHPSLQDIVGFFVNAVLFKNEIDPAEGFIDFARRVQQSVQELFRHQDYPLELVLDEVGMAYPDVTVSFNMLNMEDNRDIPLENTEPIHNENLTNVKFDMEPFVSEYKNGIEISVSYDKNIFKAENIEFMMEKYRKIIAFFALNPEKQLQDYKETKKRKSFKRKN